MSTLLVLILSLLRHAVVSTAALLNPDGVALLSFVTHWRFVPPSINSSWSPTDSTPCSWVGVQCDDAHHIVSLNLSSYEIEGHLGPELSECTTLQHLDLNTNQLSGEIPHAFTQLPHQQYVDLSYNSLTGYIPTGIGNMTQLKYLYLHYNNLSGTIPSSSGNCTKLRELYLDDNNLQGVLPETLNNLNDLVEFDVCNNSLKGTIPFGSSGRCSQNLELLDLSFNVFSGGLPSGLGNRSSLSQFVVVFPDIEQRNTTRIN